jgi:hypothetical protein
MTASPKLTASVEVSPVAGLRDFLAFCRVPRLIYGGQKGFSPSLDAERWTVYGHRLNPHYKLVRSQAFLARRDGRTVGRIEAQIYRDITPNAASPAQFGSLDAIDDQGVVAALLSAAEAWLVQHGATVMHGPFSPSINMECGMLVQGFEARPMMFTPWHPAYLSRHVEALGLTKAQDLISYRYEVSPDDRTYTPVIMNRKDWKERLRFRPLKMKELEAEVDLMTDMFNEAWAGNWGYVPISRAEFKSMADSLKFVVTEDYGFVTEIDGEPVAFGIVIPNLLEIFADLDGKIGFAGLPKLIGRIRRMPYTSGRLALFGMRKALHRSARGGIVVLTMVEHMRVLSQKVALNHFEFGWVLEGNIGMRKPIEASGAQIDKIHRIYEKRLAGAPSPTPAEMGRPT